uniref:Uncharacterized protein n=1 Tax=Chromera velia CCMP2878 TaxID=1169474 RepID=A0A0G4HLZ3_9ALVE|eukprot:Cvel_28979.t1-p1 / transcript=Cvel_28979.t1 / gene=Cvel_28979 / organism=Chromera_velia_CCMP2878 / gene_product=hypothetical protein / transcript_product=hypothetical protein / location=Cvel_scaffold3894:6329-8679(+) / protein_length=225 / sequence_SO=supercontig / SO=protein_coding / is_pseudo=false
MQQVNEEKAALYEEELNATRRSYNKSLFGNNLHVASDIDELIAIQTGMPDPPKTNLIFIDSLLDPRMQMARAYRASPSNSIKDFDDDSRTPHISRFYARMFPYRYLQTFCFVVAFAVRNWNFNPTDMSEPIEIREDSSEDEQENADRNAQITEKSVAAANAAAAALEAVPVKEEVPSEEVHEPGLKEEDTKVNTGTQRATKQKKLPYCKLNALWRSRSVEKRTIV